MSENRLEEAFQIFDKVCKLCFYVFLISDTRSEGVFCMSITFTEWNPQKNFVTD